MKLSQIQSIHALSTRFACACKIVSDAMQLGYVDASRASANDKVAKSTTITITDTSRMSPATLAELKAAIRLYNAGHAIQTVSGVKLAQIGDLCAFAKGHVEPDNVEQMPATEAAPAATEGKKKKSA